jgi:hypothetical protein
VATASLFIDGDGGGGGQEEPNHHPNRNHLPLKPF